MKEMKRVLALVLCFVMLVGYLPAGALAAETETVLPAVEAVLGEGVSTWVPQEEQDATEPATEEFVETATEAPEELGSFDSDAAQTPEEDAAVSEEDIANALIEAEAFVKGLMDSNDPQTVVENTSRFFDWDYEMRKYPGSPYLYEWSYYNGVVFEGIDNLYDVTGEEGYSAYVEEYLDAMITDGALNSYAGYVNTHGADCYKTASLLLDYYALTGNEEYKTVAQTLYTDLQNAKANYTNSNIGGNFYHTWKLAEENGYDLWLDGLYMILPFMAEYAASYDKAELDLIAERLAWVSENMYDDEQSGLFHHAIDAANGPFNNNRQFWGRAIGWYAAALVDVMDYMEGQNLEDMEAQLKKLVDGMIPYQSADGMWHQYVNNAYSEKETSVTALMGYAIMKAVNEGWLADSYAEYANKAFVGICDYALDSEGLHYICHKGSTSGYSGVYKTMYINEGKGVGPFIMLFAEMEESVYGASAPETPVIPDAPVTPDVIVPTVEGVELTGEILDVTNDETVVAAMATLEDVENFMAFEIPAEQPAEGETATVSVAIPESWNTDDLKAYYINDAGEIAETIEGTYADGKFSFEVSHFSKYAIGSGKLSGNNQITTAVTSIVSGSYYRIVSHTDTTTDRYLSNLMAPASGTGYDADGVNRLRLTTEPHYWYVTQVQGGYTVQYGGPEGQYLAVGNLSTGNNNNTAVEMRDEYTVLQLGYHTGNKAWGVWIADNGTNRYMNHHRPKNNQNTYVVGTWTGSHENGNDVASRWRFDRVVFGTSEAVTLRLDVEKNVIRPNDELTIVPTVKVGDTQKTNYTITWESSDTTVATVKNGVVTALKNGKVNITAKLTAVDGVAVAEQAVAALEITVQTKKPVSIALKNDSGTVDQHDTLDTLTGGMITVTYDDKTTEDMPITVSMLTTSTGSEVGTSIVGTFRNLTVTFPGTEVKTSGFSLTVKEKPDVNYPEYPNPGAVRLGKTDTNTVQFQDIGVAQIELTTSGIPMRKGVDVVLTVDVSNSMAWEVGSTVEQVANTSKLDHVMDAIDTFAEIFLAPYDDDTPTDNTISIVYFAGKDTQHWGGASNDASIDSVMTAAQRVSDVNVIKQLTSRTKFTRYSDRTYYLDIGYINAQGNVATLSGANRGDTNYDYAFWQTEQAVDAIIAANGENSNRDVHVLFMTDGCPSNFDNVYYNAGGVANYHQPGTKTDYQKMSATATGKPNNGLLWVNWLKDAAKDGHIYATRVNQKVNGIYAIAFDMENGQIGGISNWNNVNKATDFNEIVSKLVIDQSGNGLIPVTNATKKEELKAFYESLAHELRVAATDAYFMDQMGDDFDIQLGAYKHKTGINDDGDPIDYYVALNPAPQIVISSYKIYTAADVGKTIDGVKVESTMVGERYGSPTVLETVVFNAAGDSAYHPDDADLVTGPVQVDGNFLKGPDGETNITATYYKPKAGTKDLRGEDKVIYADKFWYNTNPETAVQIDTNGDGTKDFTLEPETFRWNIGTISQTEFVMDYFVYLEGAAEGKAEAGTYATNNFAKLKYINWLGEEAEQQVQSPTLAWKAAQVSYGFYLVNKDGVPVTNRATGKTGSFYDAYKVTREVFYDTILLNAEQTVTLNVETLDVLPNGYTSYNNLSTYMVDVNSDNNLSGWVIWTDTNKNGVYDKGVDAESDGTTYVTGFDGARASNVGHMKEDDYDYTNTTVWFPVLWEPMAVPDVVVVDYGLSVDINVLENDMFGSAGSLVGVGGVDKKDATENNVLYHVTPDTDFGQTYTSTYGSAAWRNGKVRYTPKTMAWNGDNQDSYDKFSYEALYKHEVDTVDGPEVQDEYYYGDVTVIPATIIYYEDSFTEVKEGDTITRNGIKYTGAWEVVGSESDLTQAEDRPGVYNLPGIDADNIYGFDQAYATMSDFSMGSVHKVHVDADNYAMVEFDFYGTGFDVLSLTSNKSGTLAVKVKDAVTNKVVKTLAVDTYYGYDYSMYYLLNVYSDGEWHVVWAEKELADLQAFYDSITKDPEEDVEETAEGDTEEGAAKLVDKSTITEPADGDVAYSHEMYWMQVNTTTDGNLSDGTEEALFQVPVLKLDVGKYGHYKAEIAALYYASLDHTDDDGYDLYLDAIRIYNPAGTQYGDIPGYEEMTDEQKKAAEATMDQADGITGNLIDQDIQDAYIADSEGWPWFFELRNRIIEAKNFNPAQSNKGAIFIDQQEYAYTIADYTSFGPNNEMYLAPGQAVAFNLDLSAFRNADDEEQVADVQVALKSANGESVKVTLKRWIANSTGGYEEYNSTAVLGKDGVDSSTDRYYSIGKYVNKGGETMLSFQNDSAAGSILSITNIKVTFKEQPNQTAAVEDVMEVNGEQSDLVLASYNKEIQVQKPVEEPLPEAELEVSTRSASVKVGTSVVVKATTSADVDYVTFNGQTVTKFTENQQTGKRSWTATVKAEEAGELSVEVTAFSAENDALDTETLTVEVTEKTSVAQNLVNNILGSLSR